MASFHCSVKVGKSGSGAAHADYIERDGKYASKSKADLEYKESGNMPEFAETSGEFWSAADQHERANGSVYREFEIALPRELTQTQRLELVREFVGNEIGDRHAYTFAIHNPKAAIDGGEQPHAHIMFSERKRDGIERPAEQYFKRWNAKLPERGGCQKASTAKTPTERKADLVQLRQRFAELQNKHLAKSGHQVKVTHLSLKDQGIDREVEPHFGPKLAKELAEAVQIDRAAVPRTTASRAFHVAPPSASSLEIPTDRHGIAPTPDPLPRPKQPEEEPPLDVYLKTETAITLLANRNKEAEIEANRISVEAENKVKDLQRQGEAIKTTYHAMPKRPMLLGVKEWDTKRAELTEQHQMAAEAYKTANSSLKAAQEAQSRAKKMLGRDFATQQVLARIREQRPDWAKSYDEGKQQHEAMMLQEKQVKALQREQENAQKPIDRGLSR